MKKVRKVSGEKHSKSIALKIQKIVISLVTVSMLILGIAASVLNFSSTMSSVKQDMKEMAVLASEKVEWQITAYKNIVQELGRAERLSDPASSIEEKQELINEKVKEYGCMRGKLINPDGIAEVDGIDYNDREYFQKAMKGETYVSEPLIGKTDGELIITFAAPVWEGGQPDTKITGVVFLVMQPDLLNDIVTSINISDHSSAYMLDGNGITVAHENVDLVKERSCTIEEAKTDSSLKKIASLEEKMIAGETGISSYSFGGQTKIMAWAPVGNTTGWSLAVTAPLTDFISDTIVAIIITLVVAAVFIITGFLVAKRTGKSIGDPIKQCAVRLEQLQGGDLQSEVPVIDSDDEVGVLSKATQEITTGLNAIIGDIRYLLGTMADGDFTVKSKSTESYVGDYSEILTSLKEINGRLSEALLTIKESSNQVSLGAVQMSESAQGLAEGATDQAGAVEELTATVENVSQMARESAAKTKQTYQDMNHSVEDAQSATEAMEKLTQAMENINTTSEEIQNIIIDIENIASQTNLLSLNASIEAARAGEAGKGFAVVADQIGKLAADSAQSAVNTRELIAKSLEEIERGNQLTENTAEIFNKIIEDMRTFADISRESSETSGKQAEMLNQIEMGIEQISTVVQNNSAASEETSATSEELSAEAENMNQMIDKFIL